MMVRTGFSALAATAISIAVSMAISSLGGCTRRPAARAAPAASGYIDEWSDSRKIAGWAWDKAQPNTPVTVEIYDGTVRIGTVSADAFRQDLLKAGVGDGRHSFEFRMPA